jgi:serine O-acetyltransferase
MGECGQGRPQTEELPFPVYCRRLRDCFLFDLPAPVRGRSLFVRWFLSPSYRAVASFRLAQWLSRKRMKPLAHWVASRARTVTGAEINLRARIGPRLRLPHPNGVVIGAGVVIGPDVRIMQQVTIGGPGREVDTRSGPRYPVVEAGVNVYAGAKIVGPMRIGARASIGANAVVVDDVPEGALAVGVPARVIPAPDRKHSRSQCGTREG